MSQTSVFTQRRKWLHGAGALGLRSLVPSAMPLAFSRSVRAAESARDGRILVVLELSGGNDGLNTVIPYTDDAYYRQRPKLAIKPERVRKIDDRFGFHPNMAGFERLYKEGRMAVVHGCGYENPSFSHFTSMAFWHTAAPNSGNEYGWVGRLADALDPNPDPSFLVNIDETQSLAVRAKLHTPLVFNDPDKFVRRGDADERAILSAPVASVPDDNPSRRFLEAVARSARDASAQVRDAWGRYKTPVDYGILPLDLPKVAALIDAGLPSRLYYTAFRHNAFDTHVYQADLHGRLLTYTADAVAGFMRDLERIGQADRVTLLIFSEFGRRVPENTSRGTDHGTAGPMFLVGKHVRGGLYGKPLDIANLDSGDNFIHTTDFRRVYASVIEQWMKPADATQILGQTFETFPLIA